jgi:hypothetical protein
VIVGFVLAALSLAPVPACTKLMDDVAPVAGDDSPAADDASGSDDSTGSDDSVSSDVASELDVAPAFVPWSVDFNAIPVGNAGNLSTKVGGRLSLSRASAATVQTSASTVDTTPSTDEARVGSLGQGWQGLVIEEVRTNLVLGSRRPESRPWYGLVPTVLGTAPDGTPNAAELSCNANDIGPFEGMPSPVPPPWVGSGWFRTRAPQAPLQWDVNDDPNGVQDPAVFAFVSTTGTGVWQRSIIPSPAQLSALNFQSIDGRMRGAGTRAEPVDVYADLFQLEPGLFATEAIVTSAVAPATRAGDHLWITDAATATDGGQLSLYMLVHPKGGSSQYVADAYLWYVDAEHYAKLSSQGLTVAFGAYQATAAQPVFAPWSAVEWFFRVGAGRVSAAIRMNGGMVTRLIDATPRDAFPTGRIDLLSSGASGELSCWLERVTLYRAGAAPPGF